jgi:hypothetical protein
MTCSLLNDSDSFDEDLWKEEMKVMKIVPAELLLNKKVLHKEHNFENIST